MTSKAVDGQPRNSAGAVEEPSNQARKDTYIGSAPRPLLPVETVEHGAATARYQTPLRYPGAKSGFAGRIEQLLTAGTAKKHPFQMLVEPFAGGASTSLRLLGSGAVERCVLADADPLVAAFWQVAAAEPARLIARMRDEHEKYLTGEHSVALERWDHWRAWRPRVGMSNASARFEMAMKCLFLNRTTFSGILHGRAGPIGGRSASSKYHIACRYNPDGLAARIDYVGHLYERRRISDVWCLDWQATLETAASSYKGIPRDRMVAYLDPPYFDKSGKLYSTSFSEARSKPDRWDWVDLAAHERLASYLLEDIPYRWILSYDNRPELTQMPSLYKRNRMTPSKAARGQGVPQWVVSKRLVRLNYSAAARSGRGLASELLLTTLPPGTVPINHDFQSLPDR